MTVVFCMFGVFLLAALKGASAGSIERDDYTCHNMAQDVLTFVDGFIATSGFGFGNAVPDDLRSTVKDEVEKYIRVDITNLQSLDTFVCKLIAVTSIDDLSTVVNIPAAIIRQGYPMAVQQFRMVGMDKIETAWQVGRRFVIAAHDAGYPNWPWNITKQKARAFISGMVDDFGNDFMKMFTLMQINRDTVDIERFVDALTEATSFEEFAEISGLSHATVSAMKDELRLMEQPGYDQDTFLETADAMMRVVRMVVRSRLFDLQ